MRGRKRKVSEKEKKGGAAKKKVLFVCVGNAYRSPMAEAYAKEWFRKTYHVESAGIRPLGFIPEEVKEVLREDGVSQDIIDKLQSKPIDVRKLQEFDCIIVLSDTYFFAPKNTKVLFFYVDDPAFSPREVLISARDRIKDIVSRLPQILEESNGEKKRQGGKEVSKETGKRK